jgi:hypothetical protein
MTDKATIAGTEPIGITVKAGRDYWWCACGRSKKAVLRRLPHRLAVFAGQMDRARIGGGFLLHLQADDDATFVQRRPRGAVIVSCT